MFKNDVKKYIWNMHEVKNERWKERSVEQPDEFHKNSVVPKKYKSTLSVKL
jgi:hypothetical protein